MENKINSTTLTCFRYQIFYMDEIKPKEQLNPVLEKFLQI